MPKSQKKLVKSTKATKASPKVIQKVKTAEASDRHSKQSQILTLLQRPVGATVDEMAKAAGWQRHSVQGLMSGVLKKRLGLSIASEKEDRGRVYRVVGNVSRL